MATPLLTTDQVAGQLGITPDVVRAHIRAGRLKASNVSPARKRATYRIRQEWVDEFINGQMVLVDGGTAPRRRKATMKIENYL